MQKDVKKLEKSQLLFYFLISRDNLVNIKRQLMQHPEDENLQSLFDEERKNYDVLIEEIYRRMK